MTTIKTYHYTSFANWQKIQNEGLIPYTIGHNELREVLGEYPVGIWLWSSKLTGISHAGSVIYQVAYKGDYLVVQLEAEVNENDLLYHNERLVESLHSGTIQNFVYHEGERAVICTKRIPPSSIKLVGEYNLQERLA